MSARETIGNIEAVSREIGDINNKTILDIGCGTGELCRALANNGAEISGIDPSENAIEQAIEQGGGAKYQTATLEEMDFAPHSFDVVIFCTSLHHIPDSDGALQIALELVKSAGKIIIVEPQPDDPLYPVYCWLDDEKEVQVKAQRAIDDVINTQQVNRTKTLYLNCKYRYASLDHLVKEMMDVDQTRILSSETRTAMATAYNAAIQQDKDGDFIGHWYRLDVLELV